MTVAGQAVEGATVAENQKPEPKRNKIKTGEGRLALLLVAPTVILLALVVGYPVVKGIYQSFQSEPGLDPATGFFSTTTHWVGLANYKHWLLDQCAKTGGGTGKCPTGTLGSQFWGSVWVTIFFTVGTVTIDADGETVAFTNTSNVGSLTITKAANAAGSFTFDVDCSDNAFDHSN